MESTEAADFVASDPDIGASEAEFTVTFTKADEKAHFSASIRSMMARALSHTDMEVETVQVFFPEENTRESMHLEDFEGNGKIVAVKGYVPIESLKIGSSPRSQRSFANVISNQKM